MISRKGAKIAKKKMNCECAGAGGGNRAGCGMAGFEKRRFCLTLRNRKAQTLPSHETSFEDFLSCATQNTTGLGALLDPGKHHPREHVVVSTRLRPGGYGLSAKDQPGSEQSQFLPLFVCLDWLIVYHGGKVINGAFSVNRNSIFFLHSLTRASGGSEKGRIC